MASDALLSLHHITSTRPFAETAWIRVRDSVPHIAVRTSHPGPGERTDMTFAIVEELYAERRATLPADVDVFLFTGDNPPLDSPYPLMAYSRSAAPTCTFTVPGCTLVGWPTIGIPRLDVWAREWLERHDTPFAARDDVMYWVGGDMPYRREVLRRTAHLRGVKMRIFSGAHDFEPLVEQGGYRYMLDMQGLGWSARLMHLMWMGSVVFVMDRPLNEYWWHHFVPWVHFVPVAHDASDLEAALDRVRASPDGGQSIATACRLKAAEVLTEKHAKDHFEATLWSFVATHGVVR